MGTGKVVVCNSSRQKGKTFMISNILLYYACNNAKTKNYCVSPTIKQAKIIFKTIVDAISSSGVMKSKNATDLRITLINGSTIWFKSAEQREALRGETVTGILAIDECAFIADEIFYLILPWVDAHKSPILMTSTPFVKSGFFYQYYNYGLDNQHNTVTVDWSKPEYKTSIEQILPPERLEQYRQVLPKNVFRTEYLGEFLDDDGSVFTEYTKCYKENKIKPTDKLYFGIDWAAGGEGDDTAISAINQYGEQVFLEYFNNQSPTMQTRRIGAILDKYQNQIVCIQTELNSLGTPLTDFLKERSQILANKFIGFNTSNTSKNAIVTNLQMAFEKREITILPDEKQSRELGYYTATFNPKTRNVSYNAPTGLHDDLCIALMLSYDAYKNGASTGTYSFGFKKGYGTPKENKTKYGMSRG